MEPGHRGFDVQVQIRTVAGAEDLPLPQQATRDAAGIDLRARVDEVLTLHPGGRYRVPTGIAIALPPGFEAQVRPRSGLAWKHGLTLLNSPGTIDADYRGEIQVILIHHGDQLFTVRRGDRIAQLVVQRLPTVRWCAVEELSETERGAGGFGHTGDH